VLVVGGSNGTTTLASAEIYHPATGTFSPTGSLATARIGHTAILLADGTVLVMGGISSTTIPASAEIYRPTTGTFSGTGSLATGRVGDTATLLADGTVLVTGGANGTTTLASAEIYHPATGTFSPTGSLTTARVYQTATLLTDGTVLVVGGLVSSQFTLVGTLGSAEIYYPATGTFSPTGGLVTSRGDYTVTVLADGKVLVAGGEDREHTIGEVFLASAEIFGFVTVTSPTVVIDAPTNGTIIETSFTVNGWAVDLGARTGVDAVYVWAYQLHPPPRQPSRRPALAVRASVYSPTMDPESLIRVCPT
jgi:hypothetical protein